MKKRILAFVLCICLMLPLFVGGVFATGERTATAYDGDIGRTAIFNSYYFDGGSFFISDAPENESGWAMSARMAATEEFSDLLFVITDVCVVEKGEGVPSEYWYKVEAAEGYVLPAELTEKPWIFQNVEGDSPDYDSLIVDRTSGLAETDPEEEAEEPEEEQPVESENGLALLEEGSEEGTAEPEWVSYPDWIIGQIEKMFNDPGMYVGYEAVFDTVTWTNFQFAENPSESVPAEEENWIKTEDLADEQGNAPHIVISGYAVDAEERLWYKIEAAEGYSLPEELLNNPYVLCLENEYDPPSLTVLPLQGMFIGETVDIRDKAVEATKTVTLNTADLPDFFDLTPTDMYGNYYDLGDVSDWYSDTNVVYRYVKAENVILIAPEVTVAYEKLKNAETAREFEEIWENLPEDIRNQFTSKHIEILDKKHEEISNVEKNCTVDYNGKILNVSVTGAIPANVELFVEPVSAETVLAEGFDVKSATEIITALDIKLLYGNGTEWQPEEGERIAVSIDMASLGIPDETVVRLHHKHGDDIYVFDVFIVLDGKVAVGVNGLSTFAVTAVESTNKVQNAETYDPGERIYMTVGEERIFYTNIRNNPSNPGNWVGTWQVSDTSGAIFYEVFSAQEPNHDEGMYVPWIRVVALKEATNVTITFRYAEITYNSYGQAQNVNNQNTEVHPINITAPKADDGKRLYLKDDVNASGRIIATLVDNNGNEIEGGLDGAAFSWSRYDDVNGGGVFIVPAAYELNYRAVNIARDHGGLVEARKKDGSYSPVTYTVVATLSDGTTETADYTVQYQSEILNASFESPTLSSRGGNYIYFPNGWSQLLWKTTAPGTNGNLIRDIEFGAVNGANTTGFGVPRASEGQQFAELNAEEFGALYQDIISVPHENIEWDFTHAPRQKQNWTGTNFANKMFVVIGATEDAQKLTTQAHLEALGAEAKTAAKDLPTQQEREAFYNGTKGIPVEYDHATYMVWYHDAGAPPEGNGGNSYYTPEKKYGWTEISGSYDVPDGQYRTRLFFVTDPPRNNNGDAEDGTKNFGNLIDTAKAGQYKKYLIEYYEQTINTETQQVVTEYRDKVLVDKDTGKEVEATEYGEALVYSSVPILNLDKFLEEENDYLYMIKINGENYPYDIRYSGQPSLYIEQYKGKKEYPEGVTSPNDYSKYDIVMQIFVRDTVVAIQKVIEFPTVEDKDNPGEKIELLTTVQKLELISGLADGYHADFSLQFKDEKRDDAHTSTAKVTAPDPKGQYTGFVALGENPEVGPRYVVEETETTDLVGLELDYVTFETTLYTFGEGTELAPSQYDSTQIDGDADLFSTEFAFSEKQKIADIKVTNKYREKLTTIYYKAIGNGKVALTGQTNFEDTPTETLAFYSGKSKGVQIHKGAGAIFAGWFKDEACTDPVTATDGVVDPVTGTFKPNANIIKDDEITFYAKFTTASIVIERENGEPGQSFVYHVTNNKEGKDKVDFYLTIVCGEDKKGSAIITEVPAGDYTITEIPDWSWRFEDPVSKTVNVKADADINHLEQTVTFTGDVDKPYWLSGLAEIARNIFKGGASS